MLNCCKGDKVAPVLHPECFPFSVSEGDELYAQEGEKCTNLWRSARYPSCELGESLFTRITPGLVMCSYLQGFVGIQGPRNQFSQTTSYIDGSVIYGNSDDVIRTFREVNLDDPHGYMTTFSSPDGRKLLPVSTDLLDGCNVPDRVAKGEFCFTSGTRS